VDFLKTCGDRGKVEGESPWNCGSGSINGNSGGGGVLEMSGGGGWLNGQETEGK